MTDEKTASFLWICWRKSGTKVPLSTRASPLASRGFSFLPGADYPAPSGVLQCTEPTICGGESFRIRAASGDRGCARGKGGISRAMEEDQRHYERLTSILKEKHLHTLMQSGMNEKAALRAAEKKAIEDARFVLPNACTTKMLVTMNARSLRNFFRLRCCNRAQWEIRELAEKMLYLCREVAPHLFRTAGPACVAGPCPEGKMSCGRAAEMRNRYTVRD